MKPIASLALTAMTLLTGCALVPGLAGTTGHATLLLAPSFRSSGLHTQAIVEGYSAADIQHLQLKLFKVANGSEATVVVDGSPLLLDLPQASLSQRVTITDLAPGTRYRVKAYAYSDAGTSDLISTEDASSSVDIPVDTDDRPTFAMVPVQLIDRTFDGQATASHIAVTDGDLVHTGSESIGF